jgi:hypothetical protein
MGGNIPMFWKEMLEDAKMIVRAWGSAEDYNTKQLHIVQNLQ